jgi:hypothetical protein
LELHGIFGDESFVPPDRQRRAELEAILDHETASRNEMCRLSGVLYASGAVVVGALSTLVASGIYNRFGVVDSPIEAAIVWTPAVVGASAGWLAWYSVGKPVEAPSEANRTYEVGSASFIVRTFKCLIGSPHRRLGESIDKT